MAQGYVYEDDATGWRLMSASDLPNSGVVAATYGDGTHVAQVAVNAQGLITSASNVAITTASGITTLASPTGTITVTNPTGPTADVDLPTTGVTAATYGDASNVAQITVDARGRLTAAASVPIGSSSIVGADGWVDDTSETWTFASFTAGPPAVGTFTVPGDLRAKYTIGTRIKLTQTTGKFFVVIAAPTYDGVKTTVTISGGTDYTLANAAISANYHSYVANPQGYPGTFNFNLGATGWAATPTVTALFAVIGHNCHIFCDVNGTSNATTAGGTLPVTPSTDNVAGTAFSSTNNAVLATTPGEAIVTTGGVITFFRDYAGTAWTASGTKHVRYCQITYPV